MPSHRCFSAQINMGGCDDDVDGGGDDDPSK